MQADVSSADTGIDSNRAVLADDDGSQQQQRRLQLFDAKVSAVRYCCASVHKQQNPLYVIPRAMTIWLLSCQLLALKSLLEQLGQQNRLLTALTGDVLAPASPVCVQRDIRRRVQEFRYSVPVADGMLEVRPGWWV